MKKCNRLLGFLMMLLVINSCSREQDYEPKPLNLPLKAAGIISADNTFGLDLYRELAGSAEQGTNLMISPLSISQALSMAYNGANGETRDAMEEALRISGYDLDELNDLNHALVKALLSHDEKVEINIANSIWYRQEYSVLPDFIERNQNYYNAEVRSMDFNDDGCKDVINNWVSDKTNGRIPGIIDQINPESFMFLINALYFKGAWTHEFDKKSTRRQAFYPENGGEVQVDMMNRKMDLNFLANDLFSSVELPYGKGNWRMFLFLPQEGRTVAGLEKEITGKNWETWLKGFDTLREVQLSLPKFSFTYEESLKDALSLMGMDIAFTDDADFSGILPEGGLLITDVRHKTFVEVDEKGTEAAAVTSVEIGTTSIGNYIAFNRPFVFVIAEKSTGSILFIGRFMKPE